MGTVVQYYFALDEPDGTARECVTEVLRLPAAHDLRTGAPRSTPPGWSDAEINTLVEETSQIEGDVSVFDFERWIPLVGGDRTVSASGSWVQPTCPRCDAQFGAWSPLSWWETKVEPVETCPSCGHRVLIGDWQIEGIQYANTRCGVALVDEPSCAPELHELLLRTIGGRPRYAMGKI